MVNNYATEQAMDLIFVVCYCNLMERKQSLHQLIWQANLKRQVLYSEVKNPSAVLKFLLL